MEDPVMRVVLVSLRAGQSLPEHAANGLVTVYSVGGHVLFYEGAECCDMVPGTLIRLGPACRTVEAKEDSRLLVTMIKPERRLRLERPGPQGPDAGSAANPSRTTSQHRVLCFRYSGGRRVVPSSQRPRSATSARTDGATAPGELAWEYEVQGPYEFRIKVSRIARRRRRFRRRCWPVVAH